MHPVLTSILFVLQGNIKHVYQIYLLFLVSFMLLSLIWPSFILLFVLFLLSVSSFTSIDCCSSCSFLGFVIFVIFHVSSVCFFFVLGNVRNVNNSIRDVPLSTRNVLGFRMINQKPKSYHFRVITAQLYI